MRKPTIELPSDKPILMCAEMVRAVLGGSKTMTRRLLECRSIDPHGAFWDHGGYEPVEIRDAVWTFRDKSAKSLCTGAMGAPVWKCKYGTVGSKLWVKETYALIPEITYRADDDLPPGVKWKPSIFMRRQHSRITLDVVSIRVERLQAITDEDAVAEGIVGRWHPNDSKLWTWKDYPRSKQFKEDMFHYGIAVTPQSTYQGLWETINGKGSWAKNPWVWCISFKLSGALTHRDLRRDSKQSDLREVKSPRLSHSSDKAESANTL